MIPTQDRKLSFETPALCNEKLIRKTPRLKRENENPASVGGISRTYATDKSKKGETLKFKTAFKHEKQK
jgi:hypothetical protein